jgi:hypothetical protein
MDLSKLPKLSQSPPPPANDEESQTAPTAGQSAGVPTEAPPRAVRPANYEPTPTGIPAEAWISAVLCIIFLWMGWDFAKYAGCVLTGQTYHTNINWVEGAKAGTEVAYPELQGNVIWNDSGMLVFGLALLAEAAVLIALGTNAKFQRPLAGIGFFLAFIAAAYNVIVAGIFFNAGILPLMSLVAVAFGGYMATYLWRLFQSPHLSQQSSSPR